MSSPEASEASEASVKAQCSQMTDVRHHAPAKVSIGSLGHPQLCHKPCLFINRGSCPAGSNCNFCHCCHSDRHLSRKQREEMSRLGEADVLALVLPHLLAKNLPAQELIALLEQHLVSLPSQARPAMRSNIEGLNRCLASLKFRQLVDLCACKERSEIHESILNLQAIIAAQDPALYAQSFSV
mmetsp:Transcript_46641/g.110910  ORF Transcript_46641/g.110910 Transcript_46641/m.110910 type:complete len:183 (+) Transcript_46641:23-571(+)